MVSSWRSTRERVIEHKVRRSATREVSIEGVNSKRKALRYDGNARVRERPRHRIHKNQCVAIPSLTQVHRSSSIPTRNTQPLRPRDQSELKTY